MSDWIIRSGELSHENEELHCECKHAKRSPKDFISSHRHLRPGRRCERAEVSGCLGREVWVRGYEWSERHSLATVAHACRLQKLIVVNGRNTRVYNYHRYMLSPEYNVVQGLDAGIVADRCKLLYFLE